MLLNPKMNNYELSLPSDWLYDEVVNKYTRYFKSEKSIYPKLINFINSTIQSISWPSISLTNVEQREKGKTKSFRGGEPAELGFTKEVTITFKCSENYLNYMIMRDLLFEYMKTVGNAKDSFMPDIMLNMLDSSGRVVMTFQYIDIVYFAITELELSMGSNTAEYRSFDIQLAYKDIKISSYKD